MAQTGGGSGLIRIGEFGGLHWLAVLLAAITGAVHLVLANRLLPGNPPAQFGGVSVGLGFGTLFVVAGVGFFLGILVFVTRFWRREFYLLAAVFPGVMVVLWLANGMPVIQLGGPDKVVQVLLIVVSLYLFQSEG